MATQSEERGLFQKVRLSEIVSKFTGEGDVAAWIRQVRIAKRVMKLEDEELADLASLALKDKAFAVYEELEETDKTNFEKIAEALMTAFAEDPISAQIAAGDRKYVSGEGVDVFLNEVKRLGRIAKANETTVKFWFITGLPDQVKKQLRATPKIHELALPKVLDMARAMVQSMEDEKEAAAAVAEEEVQAEVVAVAETRSSKKKPKF